jgi:hypothetical protein
MGEGGRKEGRKERRKEGKKDGRVNPQSLLFMRGYAQL